MISEDQVMEQINVMESKVSSELGPLAVEAIKNVREAMYPVCPFRNVGICVLVHESKLAHGKLLLDSMYLVFYDAPYED